MAERLKGVGPGLVLAGRTGPCQCHAQQLANAARPHSFLAFYFQKKKKKKTASSTESTGGQEPGKRQHAERVSKALSEIRSNSPGSMWIDLSSTLIDSDSMQKV